jgi:murein DD-endopeptidase MepM/ murein hydrolase activator NlpD
MQNNVLKSDKNIRLIKITAFFSILMLISCFLLTSTVPDASAYDANNPDEVYAANRNNSKARAETQTAEEGVGAMLAAVEADVADIESSQIPAANVAFETATNNLQVATEKAEKIARRLEAASSDKVRIEKQLEIASTNFDSSKAAIASLLREEMRSDDQLQSVKLIMSAGDSGEFVEDLETQAAASRTQSRVLNNSAFAKADAQTKDARLKIVNQLIDDLKVQADENKAVAQKAEEDAQKWKEELDILQAQLIAKKADLEYQKANLEAQMAQFEAEQRQIAADMAELAKNADNNAFDGSGGFFSFPVKDHRITAPYGYDPNHPFMANHTGVDFGYSGCYAPIYAAADGVVIAVVRDFAGANIVKINHGSSGGHNWMTWYVHMWNDGVYVSQGQWVSRGEKIAAIGSSGMSTGCHLHFEVWKDGQHIDPMLVL